MSGVAIEYRTPSHTVSSEQMRIAHRELDTDADRTHRELDTDACHTHTPSSNRCIGKKI